MFYSPICHQNPEKSFMFNNLQFLVCSRCFGIYIGAFISSILIILCSKIKIKLQLVFFSIIPMIADIILYRTEIYSYNKIISLLTGFSFGAILFLFIFETINEATFIKTK